MRMLQFDHSLILNFVIVPNVNCVMSRAVVVECRRILKLSRDDPL